MPAPEGTSTSGGSGIRPAVGDRDAVLTAPGSLKKDAVRKMENEVGEEHDVPRVTENCDTLSRIFNWKLGQCALSNRSMASLRPKALRFS